MSHTLLERDRGLLGTDGGWNTVKVTLDEDSLTANKV